MADSYSQLRHICNGVLLGHNPEETWVLVVSGYSVYLDDSGHPADKPYLVLGGFIASVDRWIAFEKPWKDCLRARGIDFPFHATDFFAKHKGDPKLKHILADLVIVIADHVEAAFSVTVDVDVYKEFNREQRLEEFAGTPYAILTRLLLKNVDDWQKSVGGHDGLPAGSRRH